MNTGVTATHPSLSSSLSLQHQSSEDIVARRGFVPYSPLTSTLWASKVRFNIRERQWVAEAMKTKQQQQWEEDVDNKPSH